VPPCIGPSSRRRTFPQPLPLRLTPSFFLEDTQRSEIVLTPWKALSGLPIGCDGRVVSRPREVGLRRRRPPSYTVSETDALRPEATCAENNFPDSSSPSQGGAERDRWVKRGFGNADLCIRSRNAPSEAAMSGRRSSRSRARQRNRRRRAAKRCPGWKNRRPFTNQHRDRMLELRALDAYIDELGLCSL